MLNKSIWIIIVLLALPLHAWAVPGVVIEAKGEVNITIDGKRLDKLQSGTELPDGATIRTGSNGHAVILLASGQMHRLRPDETHITTSNEPIQGNVPIIRGISVALNEVTRKDDDQAVHAMVKAPAEKFELTPARKIKLDEDLQRVDQMNLSTEEGRKLLKAQVYYKYRQHDQALGLLNALSTAQNDPSPLVISLISLIKAKR
jgi:hypothetical protein